MTDNANNHRTMVCGAIIVFVIIPIIALLLSSCGQSIEDKFKSGASLTEAEWRQMNEENTVKEIIVEDTSNVSEFIKKSKEELSKQSLYNPYNHMEQPIQSNLSY